MRHSKLADRIEEVISEPSKMEIKLKVCVGWVRAGSVCTVVWMLSFSCLLFPSTDHFLKHKLHELEYCPSSPMGLVGYRV